jgi:site-specific DNA-methyltransferase (adenine-specific)
MSYEILRGDCLAVLKTIPDASIDAVITDPPYGINTKSDGNGKLSPWGDLTNASLWYAAWISECRRVLRPTGALWTCLNWRSMVTFQKVSCDIGWPIESMLIWDKGWIGPGGPHGLRPSYEMVALWRMPEFSIKNRGLPDIQKFKWSAHKPNGHPAEKPVDLMAFLIEHTCPHGGTVLDAFTGSGTTGVAAIQADRAFIGIEQDEKWADVAEKRIAAVYVGDLL